MVFIPFGLFDCHDKMSCLDSSVIPLAEDASHEGDGLERNERHEQNGLETDAHHVASHREALTVLFDHRRDAIDDHHDHRRDHARSEDDESLCTEDGAEDEADEGTEDERCDLVLAQKQPDLWPVGSELVLDEAAGNCQHNHESQHSCFSFCFWFFISSTSRK